MLLFNYKHPHWIASNRVSITFTNVFFFFFFFSIEFPSSSIYFTKSVRGVCREPLTSNLLSSPFSPRVRLFSALFPSSAKGTPAYISLIKSNAADHTHPILSATFSLYAASTFSLFLSFLPFCHGDKLRGCSPPPRRDARALATHLNARPALLSHAGHLQITIDTAAILCSLDLFRQQPTSLLSLSISPFFP